MDRMLPRHKTILCVNNECINSNECSMANSCKFLSITKQSNLENPKDKLGVLKTPLRFIPASSLVALSHVMELGATKYGPMNWRENNVKLLVYFEAALRHIFAAMDGEDLDPESGQPHAAHAMACMAIILDAKATGNLIDDRFISGAFGRLVQENVRKPK